MTTVFQGQSAATEAKQRGFSSALAVNLRIFQAKAPGFARYFHFDLNSGSGINDEAGCIGSPLAFVAAARSIELTRYRAFFVDISEPQVKALLRRPEIDTDDRCFVHHGDNAAFIRAIPEIIDSSGESPRWAIGSVIADPNGTDIPVDELAWLAAECPRMDVFINVSSTSLKRTLHLPGKYRISTIVESIKKGHWLIREPIGRWQWTMLIGRNVAVGDHRAIGFHHMHGERGKAILEMCHYRNAELKAMAGQSDLDL